MAASVHLFHPGTYCGKEQKRLPQLDSILIEQFEGAKYFWEQLEIGRKIVKQRNSIAISRLAKFLNDSDRYLRCNAAFVLAGLGDDRGFRVIIEDV